MLKKNTLICMNVSELVIKKNPKKPGLHPGLTHAVHECNET